MNIYHNLWNSRYSHYVSIDHPSAGLCTTSFSKSFSPWERTPAAADPLHTNYCLKNHTQCWVISLFIYTFTILQINKAYSKGFVFFKIASFHAHAPVSTRNKLNLNSYIKCVSNPLQEKSSNISSNLSNLLLAVHNNLHRYRHDVINN